MITEVLVHLATITLSLNASRRHVHGPESYIYNCATFAVSTSLTSSLPFPSLSSPRPGPRFLVLSFIKGFLLVCSIDPSDLLEAGLLHNYAARILLLVAPRESSLLSLIWGAGRSYHQAWWHGHTPSEEDSPGER